MKEFVFLEADGIEGGVMADFGHKAMTVNIGEFVARVDTWGDRTFTLRVGKKRYFFSDSDRFGPYLESKDGRELKAQPISERHPFWGPYMVWRLKLGRRCRKVGRFYVCAWRAPRRGQYWKDESGMAHFLCDEEYEGLGYERVPRPALQSTRE